MLNKALNRAHIQEREAQRYIRKGVFDKAIELERSVLSDLEVNNTCLRSRCSGHVTGYQLIRDQYPHFLDLTQFLSG